MEARDIAHRQETLFRVWHIPTSTLVCEEESLPAVCAHVKSTTGMGIPMAELMVEELTPSFALVRQLLGDQITEVMPSTWLAPQAQPA